MKNYLRNYFILFFFLNLIYPQFGKNIVQYDKFNWKFIQTENFDIYYYNDCKDHAEFAAYVAEKAADKIENYLGWKLSKRSDIFIISRRKKRNKK